MLLLLNNALDVKEQTTNDNDMIIKKNEFDNILTLKEDENDDVVIENNNKEESIKINISNEDKKKEQKNFIGIIRFDNGQEVYIYDNPTDNHMRLGAGKLINGSILNERGNSILFSHRETHFKVLKNVKKGDIITIKTTKNSKRYKVVNTYVTEDDNPKPYKSSDDIRITLITCYPFLDGASFDERYVVVAKII